MKPAPIYIPSKGRAQHLFTMRHLLTLGVDDFHVIVEPHEVEAYEEALQGQGTVLELPARYKEEYDLCHLEGDEYDTTSTGAGPARNYAWDHSTDVLKARWHWVMDDNIQGFYVANRNAIIKADTRLWFQWMEYFAACYSNVLMAGPNYEMFIVATLASKPFIANTRIYSCNLIRNDAPFRWRCQLNEDTILSLDMLSAGYCTILFNHFVADKMWTQRLSGGNTDELYWAGTEAKSRMLYQQYPEVTELVDRYGRAHHEVNYEAFPNPLKAKPPSRRPTPPPVLKLVGPDDPEEQSPRAQAALEWHNAEHGFQP